MKGKYFYSICRSMYRIYFDDGNNIEQTDERFFTREEASRRVYELNGWKPKTPQK